MMNVSYSEKTCINPVLTIHENYNFSKYHWRLVIKSTKLKPQKK